MGNFDISYSEVLKERIEHLKSKIEELKEKKVSIAKMNDMIDIKINYLNVEIRALNEELEKNNEKINSDGVDHIKENANKEKIEQYNTYINNLNALKGTVETKAAEEKIDRKIRHLENKIEGLKGKNVFIAKVNRTIIYPKYLYNHLKNRKLYRTEAKVEFNQSRLNDNEKIKESINTDTIIGKIQKSYYEKKSNSYRKKLESSKSKLEELKKKAVEYNGSRSMPLNKKIKEKFANTNAKNQELLLAR